MVGHIKTFQLTLFDEECVNDDGHISIGYILLMALASGIRSKTVKKL